MRGEGSCDKCCRSKKKMIKGEVEMLRKKRRMGRRRGEAVGDKRGERKDKSRTGG